MSTIIKLKSLIIDSFAIKADDMALDMDSKQISFSNFDDEATNHHLIEMYVFSEQVFVTAESSNHTIEVNCIISSINEMTGSMVLTLSSQITFTSKRNK